MSRFRLHLNKGASTPTPPPPPGARVAPTLSYPSAGNPPTIGIQIPQDAAVGDVLTLQWSQSETFASAVSSGSHTLTSGETAGGTITGFGIPTLPSSPSWYFRARVTSGGDWSNTVAWSDAVAPVISTNAAQSQMELFPLAVTLAANKTVSWSLVGGSDFTQFEVSGSTLRWYNNGTQNLDTPADSNENNTYVAIVRATDLAGNTTDKTITVTVTAADKTADAFSFTDVIPATPSTVYTSNTITVAGLTSGLSITATLSAGQYSKNGGAFTAAGSFSVQNGDTIALKTTSGSGGSDIVNLTLSLGMGVSDTWTVSNTSTLDPSTLPHLQAWYDPSDLSTMFQDTAGTTPITADGQAVARINDKSGNGNHLMQSTAGQRPLYKTSGGKSWLLFDGSDDFLQQNGGSTIGCATAVIAAQIESDTASFHALVGNGFDQAGDVDYIWLRDNTNNQFWVAAGESLANSTHFWRNKTTQTIAFTPGTPEVYSADGTGRTGAIVFTSTQMKIGTSRSDGPFHGRIYGLVLCGSSDTEILSATDRHTAEDYLAAKSGAY